MNRYNPTLLTTLGGFLSAAIALIPLLPFPILVLLSYFAPLPLLLVGLGVGLRAFYGAGLLATSLILLSGDFLSAGQFFLFSALCPGILLSRILLNRPTSSGKVSWYPSPLILRDFTFLLGAIAVCAFGCYVYTVQTGYLQTLLQPLLTLLNSQGQAREIFLHLVPFIPGLFAFSWGMTLLVNGILAQGLLVRFQHNLRPTPPLTTLQAPLSFTIAFGVCILLSLVGVGYVDAFGKTGALVLAFPFFLIGLGIIHQWLYRTTYSTLWFTLFYVSLILLTWPIVFAVLLGLLRPWLTKLMPSH